jgi:NMT1/THI5 like
MTESTAMRLTLFENYRFVVYAPFYAAHTTGAYAAEGLDVEMSPSPGAGKAEEALIAGAVDVIWAGPMRVIKHHDDHSEAPLVCFAEIVCRDPFSILGRTANSDFRLGDLAGLRFASVSEVPTPWLCLQQDLREAGIDPNRLDRVTDRSMAENLAALREGRLDAVQLFEPLVEEAVTSGAGHLWYQASGRGRTSYTGLCHDPRTAGAASGGPAPHGSRYPSYPAMALRRAGGGNRRCRGGLFSGLRPEAAGRLDRPLSQAAGLGREPGIAGGRLRPAAARAGFGQICPAQHPVCGLCRQHAGAADDRGNAIAKVNDSLRIAFVTDR